MYAIHTTPGFIVSSQSSGEAGKLLSIFTKDLGLIRATAQGIRFEKSKLRPFIQDYSRGIFSFVRGKEFWRLTSAQEIKLQGTSEKAQAESLDQSQELIARIALLLNRLLQGEDPHPELFITLNSLFDFLSANTSSADGGARLDAESFKTLESLIVTRILHRLGYVASIPSLKEDIESDAIDPLRLADLRDFRTTLNQHINRALRESHL